MNQNKGVKINLRGFPGGLPMQGTRVRALVWEDPTCRGAAKPVCHNYWSPRTLEPMLHNKRSHHSETPAHHNEE